MHHNMRPTTLLQKCRHAMAINEQRSSFSHTPFIAYLGPTVSGNELKRARNTSLDGGKECLRTQAMWNRKIEQRWFVGAHSNIGGGYEDNVLAQRPLHWVLEGATKAGLECGTLDVTGWPIYGAPHPRDSYEEFANPFWTLILRGKRFYRRIAPPPELRANLDAQDRAQSNGFVLKHVHEELDESVFAYYLPANATVPPNLLEYAGRVVESTERVGKKGKLNNPTYLTRMLAIAQKQCDDRWPGRTIAGTALQIAALLGWSLLAAWGVVVANDLFLTSPQVPLVVVHLAFILICLADIAELTVGFSLARRGGGECRRAAVDVLYWLRSVGFVLFTFGAVASIAHGIIALYNGISPWLELRPIHVASASDQANAVARCAGKLLLLQAGIVAFLKAAYWCGETMRTANLGSIVPLQLRARPSAVTELLRKWWNSLLCGPNPLVAPNFNPVRAALWRDILGFIPLYTLVFGFGSWLAVTELTPSTLPWLMLPPWLFDWLKKYWWLFPSLAALADYLEDFCHLKYLGLFEKQRPIPALLTGFSFSMTVTKFMALAVASALTLAAVIGLTDMILRDVTSAGWRGLLSVTLSSFSLLVIVGIAIWAAIYRAQNKGLRTTRSG